MIPTPLIFSAFSTAGIFLHNAFILSSIASRFALTDSYVSSIILIVILAESFPSVTPTERSAASHKLLAFFIPTALNFISLQILLIPSAPIPFTSLGSGVCFNTARLLIAVMLLNTFLYSGKCIAIHLCI